MTDSMTRKPYFGQTIDKGFEADVHAANGAPKESFVRVEKAEEGGLHGEGLWKPADDGFRPTYESETMSKYLQGAFIAVEGGSGDTAGAEEGSN
jgi:nitrate reductase alpha subunit